MAISLASQIVAVMSASHHIAIRPLSCSFCIFHQDKARKEWRVEDGVPMQQSVSPDIKIRWDPNRARTTVQKQGILLTGSSPGAFLAA